MNISHLRREYMSQGLRRKDLRTSPFEQFDYWFNQARQAEIPDPNAMVLSTCGIDRQPSSRNVLLKAYDTSGFIFYTNQESRKASQIQENNQVSLLFSWLPLNRQIKIEGKAKKLSAARAAKYFFTRPRESQLAAWASTQSQKISSRQILEEQYFRMKEKFSRKEVPLPSFWGGYLVTPHQMEFWQGRENRLHDRFVYRLEASGAWEISRLAP
jgi:pyridoxamine 5'-phosphate oxidase